ncbi:hypothetical protein FOMPIDRAFT_162696 [Fomitopsis schrenkii]|uniref:Uncharacterized protein n=1 Tax=Fomitopsis schrenkii TaxID=2126942 RepID=S8DNB1_FOMSC|nr:hypothetical protein FOMPIDRAFT_162696 [Fomitopsis schrenkii]
MAPFLNSAEPFEKLPRALIPTRRIAHQPPILHYGWLAPRRALVEYARSNKLSRQYGRDLDDVNCIMRALKALNKKSKAKIPDDLLHLSDTVTGGWKEETTLFISLYSNFDLKRKDLPSQDAIERLQSALGVEGPPKWFLDGAEFRWCPW